MNISQLKYLLPVTFLIIMFAGCQNKEDVTNTNDVNANTNAIVENNDNTRINSTVDTDMLETWKSDQILFSCTQEINVFNISKNEIINILVDNEFYFSNIGINKEKIFFLRSSDLNKGKISVIDPFGPNEIFRMNFDGTHLEQITDDSYEDINLSVLGSREEIFYVSERNTLDSRERWQLIAYDINNKSERILYSNNEQFIPILSPSGNKIAILQFTKDYSGIYVYDINNESIIQLAQSAKIIGSAVSWVSRDDSIVYAAFDKDKYKIYDVELGTDISKMLLEVSEQPESISISTNNDLLIIESVDTNTIWENGARNLWLYKFADKEMISIHTGNRFRHNAIIDKTGNVLAYFIDNEQENDKLVLYDLQDEELISEINSTCSYINQAEWITIE